MQSLTIRGRWAVWVLLVFALAASLTVLDTVIWWKDGPRFTHAHWFGDRMDRINEDDKLRDLIRNERDARKQETLELRELIRGACR